MSSLNYLLPNSLLMVMRLYLIFEELEDKDYFDSFVFINQKLKTMKIKQNFITGVLSGICGILVLIAIIGSTTPETTTKFEFHDLGDTRGLIFNKVTGQMEYKQIRTELTTQRVELRWSIGEPGSNSVYPFYISQE